MEKFTGYNGISFPFRVFNGGVVMSTTSVNNVKHIEESVIQILNTHFLERPMESDIYSDIEPLLFEPNDVALQNVLALRIEEALSIDERIECSKDDITFSVENKNGNEILYANVTYKVIKYNTYYSSKVKVGEVYE